MSTKTKMNKDTNSEIAELKAKLAAAEEKAAQEKTAFYMNLGESLNKLPAALNLKDLEEVISHIKAHQKGNLMALAGGKAPRAAHARLTEEQKKQIGVLLHAKRPAREIAAEMHCSVPTINKIKDELGLTMKRNTLATALKTA